MAQGALQPAIVQGGRIRRLKDGSYIDSATGKRYASFGDIPNNGMNTTDQPAGNVFSGAAGALANGARAVGNVLSMPVRPSASNPPDIMGALGRAPTPGADDILNREGGPALAPPAVPTPQRPAAAGGPAPNILTRDSQAIPQAAPTGALTPSAPLAASTGGGSDTTSPIPMILPTVRGQQAAHDPGAAGAYAPTPDTQQAPVIGDAGADSLSPSLATGMGALKGALGKVPGPVNITPSVGGAFNANRNLSDTSGALSPAEPDVTKGLDVTGGLGALSSENKLTPMGKDPNFLERIGGALGLRDSGPNSTFADNGANLTSLMSDPNRMAMLEAGLGTMAAAGQPGATLGGALGQGGLGALHNRDIRQERADKTKEEQLRLDTEMARYDADRSERAAYHKDENNHWVATNNREGARDRASAAQALVGNAQKEREFDLEGRRIDSNDRNTAALRAIEAKGADTAAGRASSEDQATHDKGFSESYDNYLKSQKTNSTGTLDALINPKDATRLDQDAKWNAATQFPKATQSKTVANQVILRTQGEVQKNGGVMTTDQKNTIAQARAILGGKR